MSVGHMGDCSKHPAKVKLAIINYIDTKLTEVIGRLRKKNTISDECELLGVFDPYDTEWDFHVLIKVNQKYAYKAWQDYFEIHREYFLTKNKDALAKLNEVLLEHGELKLKKPFHASRSKTVMHYTAVQMKYIYGEPD